MYRLFVIASFAAACSKETEVQVVPGECADGTTSDVSVDDSIAAMDTGSPPDTGVVASDTATSSDSGADSGADSSSGCAIKTGGDLCTTIPKFTGTQVVDAIGDEFCDVPATVFQVKKGVVPAGARAVGPVPDTVSARIAWDTLGIHAHFHVEDPYLLHYPANSGQYVGPDAIQLFLGGETPTFGTFDGNLYDDGFVGIQISPATTNGPKFKNMPSGMPASADYLYWRHPGNFWSPLIAPVQWSTRTIAGGYEAEVFVPWSVLGRSSAPSSGTSIAADLGMWTCNDPDAWATLPYLNCADAYYGVSYLAIKPPPGASTCDVDPVSPLCDDRTWCVPKLE
ncbi:MAG: hypothetical protein ACXVEF_20335 [Polyangiales bacterium]